MQKWREISTDMCIAICLHSVMIVTLRGRGVYIDNLTTICVTEANNFVMWETLEAFHFIADLKTTTTNLCV